MNDIREELKDMHDTPEAAAKREAINWVLFIGGIVAFLGGSAMLVRGAIASYFDFNPRHESAQAVKVEEPKSECDGIKSGQLWVYNSNNPFNSNKTYQKVLEVKSGYVHSLSTNSIQKDSDTSDGCYMFKIGSRKVSDTYKDSDIPYPKVDKTPLSKPVRSFSSQL